MSVRLLACLVLTLIGAVRSSPALLGTSRHTEEQSTSCESSAPGNGGQLALSTSESSTSNQQSHQGKATLSYTVRWHVVKVPGLGTVPQLVTVDSAATDQAALTMLPSSATACLLPFISRCGRRSYNGNTYITPGPHIVVRVPPHSSPLNHL